MSYGSASDSQSWWDAICNFHPDIRNNMVHPSVTSEKQYRIYQELRNNNHVPVSFSMTEEEQFMYVCFLAALHGEL